MFSFDIIIEWINLINFTKITTKEIFNNPFILEQLDAIEISDLCLTNMSVQLKRLPSHIKCKTFIVVDQNNIENINEISIYSIGYLFRCHIKAKNLYKIPNIICDYPFSCALHNCHITLGDVLPNCDYFISEISTLEYIYKYKKGRKISFTNNERIAELNKIDNNICLDDLIVFCGNSTEDINLPNVSNSIAIEGLKNNKITFNKVIPQNLYLNGKLENFDSFPIFIQKLNIYTLYFKSLEGFPNTKELLADGKIRLKYKI